MKRRYQGIWLDGKMYNLHRLIAEQYVANPHNKPCTNHINGDKHDNRPENLEWVTHKENTQHAFRTGLMRGLKGIQHPNARLSEEDVANIRILANAGIYQYSIAGIYSVGQSQISRIIREEQWNGK